MVREGGPPCPYCGGDEWRVPVPRSEENALVPRGVLLASYDSAGRASLDNSVELMPFTCTGCG